MLSINVYKKKEAFIWLREEIKKQMVWGCVEKENEQNRWEEKKSETKEVATRA